jgi:2,4-dienoyl-CoA reductase-like NADH-dependent reductase (Old Yellow Enzyme family)
MPNQVFENNTLAGIRLENRIIRSATCEGMADKDGFPSSDMLSLYERLSKGKVGAIITGYVAVQRNGRTVSTMGLFDDDKYIDAYRRLCFAVRENNVPFILQIAHGGGQCYAAVTPESVAPSAVKYPFYPQPHELTESAIEEIIDNFVKAIARAQKAGFSAVQVHAAHGYLLAAFLSPHFNHRQDRWSGSIENRFRILDEIIKRARQTVGNYPVLVKISAYDSFKDGANITTSVTIAGLLQESGYDAIEVSCGNAEGLSTIRVKKLPVEAVLKLHPQFARRPNWQKKLIAPIIPLLARAPQPVRNYNVAAAGQIKNKVKIPVIVVGGIRTLADIKTIITGNQADYVSMCRPFIIEPDIVARFLTGKSDTSRCIDCGYCAFGFLSGEKTRCYYGKIGR